MTGDEVLGKLIARAIEMGGELPEKASNVDDVMRLLEPVFEEVLKSRKMLDDAPDANAAALAITLRASQWFQLTTNGHDVKTPLAKLIRLFHSVRMKFTSP
jgi:hypothetical protein